MAKLDETVPGGVYIVNGRVVDAEGKPRPGWIIQDGRAVSPDEQAAQVAEQSSDSDGSDQVAVPPAGGKRGKAGAN